MRVRNWWLVVMVLLGIVAACSGNSERNNGKEPTAGTEAGSGAPSAGNSGTGARGGRGGSAGRAGAGGSSAGAGGVVTGSGGFGNVGADAGQAGEPATGGTVPIGGTGGTAGIAGSSSGGTGGLPPFAWRCSVNFWGDGQCDCGCGIQDIDCENSDDIDECVTCNRFGSCNSYQCPGRVNPDNTTACNEPPVSWNCLDYYYWDGVYCDCGCGEVDPDCENDDISSCDTCGLSGGCAGGICPASIDPDDITQCTVPDGWLCGSITYHDGYDCDCGCGIPDPDCLGTTRDYCERCTSPGSCAEDDGYCSEHIDANDNTFCSGPPPTWTCQRRFYGDGVLCHCGCGAPDPDCENRECDVCNATGACSSRPCPGMINPNNEPFCIQPEVPAGWTCDSFAYGDGFTCHCGCGVQDYDCLTADASACEDCYRCGNLECPTAVQPGDTTKCIPPPDGWRCDAALYRDGNSCECGCGAPDPDCGGTTPDNCWNCPEGSCTDYTCANLEPNDNAHCINEPPPEWTCSYAFYGDGACDCGCGVIDSDCASAARSACIFCNPTGGCSNAACPSTINADNNAICGG